MSEPMFNSPPQGWHTISAEHLLETLRRVSDGEDPDVVYGELWASADREVTDDWGPLRTEILNDPHVAGEYKHVLELEAAKSELTELREERDALIGARDEYFLEAQSAKRELMRVTRLREETGYAEMEAREQKLRRFIEESLRREHSSCSCEWCLAARAALAASSSAPLPQEQTDLGGEQGSPSGGGA